MLPVALITIYSASIAAYELTQLLSNNNIIPLEHTSNLLKETNWIRLNTTISDAIKSLTSGAENIFHTVITSLYTIINTVTALFLTFTLAFYLLKYGTDLRSLLQTTLLLENKEYITRFIDSVDNSLQKIFF